MNEAKPYIATNQMPKIEVMQGDPSMVANPQHERNKPKSRRLLIFMLVFLLISIAGLAYNYSRPAIYSATAALLTVPMPDVDQLTTEADSQHNVIQSQLLLSQPLLETLRDKLAAEMGTQNFVDVPQLRKMLSITPLADTNILELTAEGGLPMVLPLVVNTWTSVYRDMRTQNIIEATDSTTEALKEQHLALEMKVERKREELAQFRQDNDILTFGRDENQVLARLRGLTNTLNTASEDEAKTKAKLDVIRKRLKDGKPVVLAEERGNIAVLESKANALREQLMSLRLRYTDEYISINPATKMLPQQLAGIQKEIKSRIENGAEAAVDDAEQSYFAAQRLVKTTRRQLESHKRKTALFTTRFAKHEALQEGLVRLEELYRTAEARLVSVEVENRQKFSQVEVLAEAHMPLEPIWPLYWRDTAIILASALFIGLFAVWVAEFLLRKEEKGDARGASSEIRIYTGEQPQAIERGNSAITIDQSKEQLAIQQQLDEMLGVEEIQLVFESADLMGRRFIALLMSGLNFEEITTLTKNCFDLDVGLLRVVTGNVRTLSLAPSVLALFADVENELYADDQVVFSANAEELSAKIYLAAVDAGLVEPERINIRALQHSYLVYLVQQGVKLSEITQIVSNISASQLMSYAQLSPVGSGKSLDDIELVYPLEVRREHG